MITEFLQEIVARFLLGLLLLVLAPVAMIAPRFILSQMKEGLEGWED